MDGTREVRARCYIKLAARRESEPARRVKERGSKSGLVTEPSNDRLEADQVKSKGAGGAVACGDQTGGAKG